MVYEYITSPEDIATLFKEFHRAPDFVSRQRAIREAPLPKDCNIALKIPRSKIHDQDRLNLSKSMASLLDKVWGIVISIRGEEDSANTDTPASANVLLKIPFWDDESRCYRSIFVRAIAFFAGFCPRISTNSAWSIKRGDIIFGILQRLLTFPKYESLGFLFSSRNKITSLFFAHSVNWLG